MPKQLIHLTLCLLSLATSLYASELTPRDIGVLYNSDSDESRQLAEFYQQQRGIPASNLLAVKMPKQGHITRAEYNAIAPKIVEAIKKAEISNKLPVIVCMKDVPYGIKRSGPKRSKLEVNEASFDSELCLLGYNYPFDKLLNNPYFKKEETFKAWRGQQDKGKQIRLVTRIDGPSFEQCKSLISDSIATEKSGLWGMSYLDLAKKGKGYKEGDDWINAIHKLNTQHAIATVKNTRARTYPKHYPTKDVALYFGWYTTNVNGPFVEPNFRFKRGAVATHIHSFSASNLRDPNKNWVGPLLNKGACVVLGNVYEPYLQITTYLDLFHARLIKGYSVAEAAYMATPCISWQNVIIGDPLYRPFLHLAKGSGEKTAEDKPYRVLNLLWKIEKKDPKRFTERLKLIAADKKSGILYEAVALNHIQQGQHDLAATQLNTAIKLYTSDADKLRCQLHKVDLLLHQKKKQQAISLLRAVLELHKDSPHRMAAQSELLFLSPPAPSSN